MTRCRRSDVGRNGAVTRYGYDGASRLTCLFLELDQHVGNRDEPQLHAELVDAPQGRPLTFQVRLVVLDTADGLLSEAAGHDPHQYERRM